MYSGVVHFYEKMTNSVKMSRKTTNRELYVDGKKFYSGVGWFGTPTGKRYVFREEVAPDFLWKKKSWQKNFIPTYVSFSPTQIKNYPVQGLAGEVVIMCLGIIFREFLKRPHFERKALLVNSVHDCAWLDAHKEVSEEAGKLVYDVFVNAQKHVQERYKIPCPVRFRAEAEHGVNLLEMNEYHFE